MNPLVLAAVLVAFDRVPLPAQNASPTPLRSTPGQTLLVHALSSPPTLIDAAHRPVPDVFPHVVTEVPRRPGWGELGARLQSALRGVPLAAGEAAPRLLPNLRREVVDGLGVSRHVGLHGVTFTVRGQF
jgi:hypothetical protein